MNVYMTKQKKSEKKVNNKIPNNQKHNEKINSSKGASSGFYYSFLTVILLLCLVQITISAVLNISKIFSYNSKIKQITSTRNAAQALNMQLKDNINNFSNVAGLEAIARNNLKMSSEDEVMVIINEPQDDSVKEKNKILGVFRKN